MESVVDVTSVTEEVMKMVLYDLTTVAKINQTMTRPFASEIRTNTKGYGIYSKTELATPLRKKYSQAKIANKLVHAGL